MRSYEPDEINVADNDYDGEAEFSGRLINPPFLFGAGGVELVAREMTHTLQNFIKQAKDKPGTVIALEAKGISFGTIVADESGNIDTSNIEGVDDDLVVRPFGRKGEFASVREFDVAALSFHLGMQAAEAFGGEFSDEDNDGITNEISEGDLSALSIFLTTLERPRQDGSSQENSVGLEVFNQIGCADCHRPQLNTNRKTLSYKLTGSPEEPFKDSFYEVDMSRNPTNFVRSAQGGIEVPLFSDLKRHYMGNSLAEDFNLADKHQNGEFITARLWGIADTAPYMHDGRAFTLTEAIQLHDNPGGEAAQVARNFAALSGDEKNRLLTFLLSLRTPKIPTNSISQSE